MEFSPGVFMHVAIGTIVSYSLQVIIIIITQGLLTLDILSYINS